MSEKRSYTSVLIEIEGRLSTIETITKYQENHLGNIDGHLEKLNTRTHDNETQIAVNSEGVSRIYKIGGGIALGLLAIIGIITAVAFGMLNLF